MPLEAIEPVQLQVKFVGEALLGRSYFQIYRQRLRDQARQQAP
jgi:hypothetical protein